LIGHETRGMPSWACGPVLVALAIVLGGCAGGGTPPMANPHQIEAHDYRQTFVSSIQVLRDQGFTVDRQDYRFGVITTRPLGASTLFEPWVGDHATVDQAVASTLHDHRRSVRVTLEPMTRPDPQSQVEMDVIQLAMADDTRHVDSEATVNDTPMASATPADNAAPAYTMHVEVLIEQRQLPARRLIGASGRNVFTSLHEVPQEWRQRGIEREYWRPVGRDPYLENRLIAAILQQAAATPTQAPEDENP